MEHNSYFLGYVDGWNKNPMFHLIQKEELEYLIIANGIQSTDRIQSTYTVDV